MACRVGLELGDTWFVLARAVLHGDQVFFRIRGAIEHGNVPDPENAYRQTRTYFMPALLRFFFAPKQVNYHLEHHLYPSVPFYHLPRLHAVLSRAVYPAEAGYCEPFSTGLKKLIYG